MSLGVSFGSIGDLIAVGQIAWSLAKALTYTHGSTREYQGLAKELEAFNNACLQIVALWQNYESSPELEELGRVTKDGLTDWRDAILKFQLKFEKSYGTSLQAGGSGKWIRDAAKKVQWLKEKDDIVELRRKIQSASGMIILLVLAAMGKSNKLDFAMQNLRIQVVHHLLKESVMLAEEQLSHLKKLDEKMNAQAHNSELILARVTSGISSLTQVKSTVIDIKAILDIFKARMSIMEVTPRGLDTHWKQAPVTLEDALGNVIPIPLELVNSWDMFETLLAKRFEILKGHKKVVRKEYAIEDSRSHRQLDSKTIEPGDTISMHMWPISKADTMGETRASQQTSKETTDQEVEDSRTSQRGVSPLNSAKGDSAIPPDTRWTKISRRLVNPEALDAGKEIYEAREDFAIVLRVLTREEVLIYANATQQIRAAREREELKELERSHSQHKLGQ